MNSTAPFRMNRSALMLALVSAAFAGNAGASAGRIDFSIGGVVATRPDGQQRPLAKGAELQNGDTIRTNDGRAQIRFPDGAYVSLQPNTVFGVKEYNYEGKTDGKERGFFSLLKGAMRAVTGLIGRVNRSTYQITTPTATVGIRGTGGLIAVLPDGSTLIRGSSGIWSL
ncbi:MAG TPA: FecR family protein, partial [Burkholderiales bacterium]|nr:FecR family protein [Burkholderiales bacterium]